MRSLRLFFGICVPAWVAAVCLPAAGAAASDKTFVIFPPGTVEADALCRDFLQDHPSITCIPVHAGGADEQMQSIADALTSDIDGIAVWPLSPYVGELFGKARDRGIPVVTWGADLPEQDRNHRDLFVGVDSFALGAALGHLASSVDGDRSAVCVANPAHGPSAVIASPSDFFAGVQQGIGDRTLVENCIPRLGPEAAEAARQIDDAMRIYGSAVILSTGTVAGLDQLPAFGSGTSFPVFVGVGSSPADETMLVTRRSVGQADIDTAETARAALEALLGMSNGELLPDIDTKTRPTCGNPCPEVGACAITFEFTACPCPEVGACMPH